MDIQEIERGMCVPDILKMSQIQHIHPREVGEIQISLYWKCMKRNKEIIQLFNILPPATNFQNGQRGRVYSVDGVSPTLNTVQGGNLQPKIVVIE